MERLTFVKCQKQWRMGRNPTKYSSRKTFQQVVARLAEYENTGLTPDGVKAAIYALREREERKSPCDLCRYNPPSSMDGKPCAMCPASCKEEV